MEKVIVEVGYTGKNYCAHLPELPGLAVTGDSLQEIKDDIEEALPFHIEGQRETGGEVPVVFDGPYELIYKMTAEALLNEFSGIFTKSALSKITGINERQLWHYASGLRHPREKQLKRIEDGIHKLAQQLNSLTL